MKTATPDIARAPRARLLVLGAVAGLAGLAVLLAVTRGWTIPLDRMLYLTFRAANMQGQPAPAAFEAMRDLTALGSFTVLGIAVAGATGFLLSSGQHRLAMLLLFSALGATGVSSGLKVLVDRARPGMEDAAVVTFTKSFPSGHALLSTAIILTVGGVMTLSSRHAGQRRYVFSLALVLVLAIGFSRLYLGVHWASDVLAGWLFGIAWASFTLALARSIGVPGCARR